LNILILNYKNKTVEREREKDRDRDRDKAINDFQLNDNYNTYNAYSNYNTYNNITPKKNLKRNKSISNTNQIQIPYLNQINTINTLQCDKGDLNDTKKTKFNFGGNANANGNLGTGDSFYNNAFAYTSNLDISNDEYFKSIEKTRKKFDLRSTKNVIKDFDNNTNQEYKTINHTHNRSKSSVYMSEFTKTRNDVNLRNLKELNFKGEYMEKVEKNKYNLLIGIDEDNREKMNRIDYKIFKKLIIVFLWNRTYLKIKSNYKNIKNNSFEKNDY
jgi:hypothetical protein